MVDIIGRAKVIAETLVDESQAKKAGEKAGKKAADGVADGGKEGGTKFSSNFESVVGKSLPLAAIGVGAAVGTALAVGIGNQLEREATGAKFAASLGLGATEAAELNESAATIYREVWGESFEAVQRGVAATKSSFRDLSGSELTDAARAAQIYADVMGVDVVEAAGVASVAVKQGLAKDAIEAFDLMTGAAQQVPLQFRGELLSAITEYSAFFHSLGIDGPEAFALLAQGAELGQFGIDKVGDAIKEFQIRALDTSATTSDAFKLLNLDIGEMQTAIASGGDAAEEAFRTIVFAIESIEDPAAQAQAAIALFGTPLEDLSQQELPDFITALADGTQGIQDFEGATEQAGNTAGGTFSSQLAGVARDLDVLLGSAIDAAIDKLAELGDAFSDAIPTEKQIAALKAIQGDVKNTDFGDSDFIKQLTSQAVGGPASGLTLVGERGPEIVNLPNGSYVNSNINSEAMVAAASGGGDTFNITHIGNSDGLVQKLNWNSRYRRVGVQQGVNA